MKDRDRTSQTPLYVIGGFDDGLVVVAADEARRLAALNDALERSSNWAAFLQSIADDEATLSYLANQFDEQLPDPNESFDPDEVPGFAEGSWPPLPQARFNQLPESVKRLGSIRATAFDGDLVHIDEERREDVAAALAHEGLPSIDDDDLIERASGAWRYD